MYLTVYCRAVVARHHFGSAHFEMWEDDESASSFERREVRGRGGGTMFIRKKEAVDRIYL